MSRDEVPKRGIMLHCYWFFSVAAVERQRRRGGGNGRCKSTDKIGGISLRTRKERSGRSRVCASGRRNGRVESNIVYTHARASTYTYPLPTHTHPHTLKRTHIQIHTYTHTHTEKFIPENRGCVSTSMAAGRSMHSPPPS